MRFSGVIFLILTLTPCPGQSRSRRPARAAAPAPAAKAWPIATLKVEGANNYTAEGILRAAGLAAGQTAGEHEFEAARKKLQDTGLFETVGYEFKPSAAGDRIDARIIVREIPQVYPVRFENLGVSDSALMAALAKSDPLFSKKITATKPVLERYSRVIEQHIGAGRRVVGRLVPGEKEELVVMFSPAEGLPAVAEVRFAGNRSVPTAKLQGIMARTAVGLPYSETRMREVLEASIRPVFEALGLVRVAFPKIAVAPAPDVKGLVVTVDVNEGEPYKLKRVTVRGVPLPDAAIAKAAKFAEGETANFDHLNAGVERVRALLFQNGYLRADSKIERQIDDKAREVSITVLFEPGPQYKMGKLNIIGLDLHSEPVIRKLWRMKPEQPFDGSYPDLFLARIREDGVFDNLGQTKATTARDDKTLTVDVTLDFKAAPPPPKPKLP